MGAYATFAEARVTARSTRCRLAPWAASPAEDIRMTHSQRYVSSELSHFVGKGLPEDDQYNLLVNKILKPGWLTHPPHDLTIARTLYEAHKY
jgi:hypothetical protein